MNLYIFDVEVFSHDWLIVFKSHATTVVHNDNEAVKAFMEDDPLLCGFNNKHYDQFILKAILCDATPEQVKEVNDFIIGGGNGWENPFLQQYRCYFRQFDVFDDCQMGLSLKAIEAHRGKNILETEVDFDLDRPLTERELRSTIVYCKYDVDNTEELLELRKGYLETKLTLGREKGLPDDKSLYMTNAKLTAAYLDSTAREHNDERDYQYPKQLLREYIPQEVFTYFDRLYDKSLTDDEVFKEKLKFSVGNCPVVLGYGGIHGAMPCYREKAREGRTIRNKDVASYYPHLMTLFGYCSRNMPSPANFEAVVERRVRAKREGDKQTANALKLVANTTYGAMLNQYNPLYDPLMGRSVCITGQLFLLELANHLVMECPTIEIIQMNTDGIMVSLDDEDVPAFQAVCEEWETRTGFELEEDGIREIIQKDVNNYIEIQLDGSTKTKGGALVRGISPVGAFNINNNACIVAKALLEYFTENKAVADSINECDDIFQFQLIAKAGSKYTGAYQIYDGELIPAQRVNRVYAAKDERYGTLMKKHKQTGNLAKIASLPEHCIVDNDNHLTIADIDKGWYIEYAQRLVNDFLGIKPERKKKMAKKTEEKFDYSGMTMLERLALARQDFKEAGAKKTGKNMHLEFKYFELEDIVPIAEPIFGKYGMIVLMTCDNGEAVASVYTTDSGDKIMFKLPFPNFHGDITKTVHETAGVVQSIGASTTYLRRYLWALVLDLVEADNLDPHTGAPTPESKRPATPQQRQDIKSGLTAPSNPAEELQIKALKSALSKLLGLDPSQEDFVTQVALTTNSFKNLTKEDCEALLNNVEERIAKAQKGA